MSTLSAVLALATISQTPSIGQYVQTGFRDASFVAVRQSANQRELAKISDDFQQSYRFDRTRVFLKEPMMLRLEARVEGQDIFFILNGPTRLVRIPKSNINQRENLAKAPGKRQTGNDFGLLLPSMFNNFFVAKFVRNDRATGAAVFDLTYIPSLDDTSRHRVFVDPEKKVMIRREWYGQEGQLRAIFLYSDFKQFGSIWMPTKITVNNSENRAAGSTNYIDIKVNTGLSDDLFRVR
ncbi:MAG: outer membrane lipoprotein-sorting protein [Fimbriimonadaceae bacterium]|jgi:outer membrane lipoprotein-sorting protein|nr:outer membrane lipoprotein-sorting protein [Fimbriimonadaceae bacterium]